jgi:hypothetical protein
MGSLSTFMARDLMGRISGVYEKSEKVLIEQSDFTCWRWPASPN